MSFISVTRFFTLLILQLSGNKHNDIGRLHRSVMGMANTEASAFINLPVPVCQFVHSLMDSFLLIISEQLPVWWASNCVQEHRAIASSEKLGGHAPPMKILKFLSEWKFRKLLEAKPPSLLSTSTALEHLIV